MQNYKVAMTRNEIEEYTEALDHIANSLGEKEFYTARNIIKKMKHALAFPTLGIHSMTVNKSEMSFLSAVSEAYPTQLVFAEIR